jgi:hypothetical protein
MNAVRNTGQRAGFVRGGGAHDNGGQLHGSRSECHARAPQAQWGPARGPRARARAVHAPAKEDRSTRALVRLRPPRPPPRPLLSPRPIATRRNPAANGIAL